MEIEKAWAKYPGWFDEQTDTGKSALIAHYLIMAERDGRTLYEKASK